MYSPGRSKSHCQDIDSYHEHKIVRWGTMWNQPLQSIASVETLDYMEQGWRLISLTTLPHAPQFVSLVFVLVHKPEQQARLPLHCQ